MVEREAASVSTLFLLSKISILLHSLKFEDLWFNYTGTLASKFQIRSPVEVESHGGEIVIKNETYHIVASLRGDYNHIFSCRE